MLSKRLNLLDTAWLSVEKALAPMQVGGLFRFTLPVDAPADFGQRTTAHWREYRRAFSPWNRRLRGGRRMTMTPAWELLDAIDVDYHCRRCAAPARGGEVGLRALVARLHSQPLDLSRPLWECYLIEGLAGKRFAVYIKMHHALIDGVSGMRLLARSLADSASDRDRPPFWAIEPRSCISESPAPKRPGPHRVTTRIVAQARHQITSLARLTRAGHAMLNAARSGDPALALPYSAPASILNGRIQGRRGYATQLYSRSEFKVLARTARVSVNDIVLAICGGALRQYLGELGELPARPLTAGIPVSVRPANDDEYGNALTFIIATLATNLVDPEKRLRAIAASTRRARRHLARLPPAAITPYTVALMAPYVLSLVSGLAGRTRPLFNVTISNVPGPSTTLYLHGAKLDAFYPASLVTHGQALNITIHSYADTLGFGFIACRDAVSSVQRLADYASESLEELRTLYGPSAVPRDRRKTSGRAFLAGSRHRIDDRGRAHGIR